MPEIDEIDGNYYMQQIGENYYNLDYVKKRIEKELYWEIMHFFPPEAKNKLNKKKNFERLLLDQRLLYYIIEKINLIEDPRLFDDQTEYQDVYYKLGLIYYHKLKNYIAEKIPNGVFLELIIIEYLNSLVDNELYVQSYHDFDDFFKSGLINVYNDNNTRGLFLKTRDANDSNIVTWFFALPACEHRFYRDWTRHGICVKTLP
jgi:hypothetical protein